MKVLTFLFKLVKVNPRFYKGAKVLTQKDYKVTVFVWYRKGDYLKEKKIKGINLIIIHNTFLMKVLLNYLCRDSL